MSAACRSCGAPIVWAKTSTGKTMPADAQQTIDGNVRLIWDEDDKAYTRAEVGLSGSGPYVSHFATCPNAKPHRRRPAP